MATKTAEQPPVIAAEPEVNLPAAHLEQSKSIFKQARVDAGLDAPPAPKVDDPPPPPETTDDPPPPDKKSVIPEDVIDPDKSIPPKVHDAVAEIQAAELPKGAKKEQIDSFGKLKTKAASHLQAALDKAAELEKKIASGATPAAELEELRGKLTAAEERSRAISEDFEKVAFERSPKFKAQFGEREKTAIELAKSYLDGTEIKPEIVDLAAHATGRKRIEILQDAKLDESTISAVLPHLANFDTIQREKQSVLANWKVEAGKAQEELSQFSKVQMERKARQENEVWEKVVSKIDLLPLRKSKDNSEWNTRGDEIVAEAKRLYNGEGADLPTFAETILRGVASRAQDEVVDHLKGEVANLRAENAKLKSAAPGGSINAGTQDGAPVDTTKMSREEVSKQTFNQELGKARAS